MKKNPAVLFTLLILSITSLIMQITSGCQEPKVCKELETRCNKNKVEICNTSGQWMLLHDCSVEKGNWVCDEKEQSCVILVVPVEAKDAD